MQDGPRLVSVIVPTFRRPHLLRGALASIRRLEDRDLAFEILVADNGRACENRAIAEAFGATYVAVERRGPSAARNAGLRLATGDFIAFLDDDDAWLPGNVRAQIAVLDADPALDGVLGQAVGTDPDLKNPSAPWPERHPGVGDALLRTMLSGYFPQLGTLVVRRRVRDLVGLFDETLIGGEDLDWQLRIARRRTLGYVETPCMLFRGRAHGTYDAIQYDRLAYDRLVFFRHSVPEWRIWPSPLAFLRAYQGTLQHFYWYFVTIMIAAASRGQKRRAFRAIVGALRVFPVRATYHLVARRDCRRALVQMASMHRPI
ncbi:glycosyltransferase family 2 protein [Methylobacterium oryzae]|uniref:Glycosyl transferase family protein n=1 Tax=Methylobacterium oryzae CBMB20 TaxID=693986 RepID=A0A089NYI8_9HYPH|nr:glycosyltransferase family 2 protein [Methylobacterium oryzae]AIQ93016.1 Glycosyl transferase family protein [Methylobacterium oryzae CBMB20]